MRVNLRKPVPRVDNCQLESFFDDGCPRRESCANGHGSNSSTSRSTGRGDFTLSVYGANFVDGAVVNWNGSPRSTTFVSDRELRAKILAARQS